MDPPAVRRASQPPPPQPSQGFPSPAQDYARLNPKFVDDCTRMTYAIQQSLPEAVRRIVRDHWEKCLLGSEFHQAFILNASIHHALPVITQRAVRDFGGKMVADSLVELVGHISTQDLDKVADLIIAKASDGFLDKCLEKRLLTIEAKPLTQALAKAERLGFGPDDEIQQEGPHERVMPHEAYPGASTATNGSFQGHHTPPAPGYHPAQPLQCSRCYRTFGQPQPFDYHMRYNVCSQIPPTANGFVTSCQHCGQGFERGEDLQGHLHGKQCGNIDAAQAPPPAVKASRGPGRPPRATPVAQVNPVSILPSQGPAPNGQLSSQPQSTPVASRVANHVAGTPGTAGSPNTSDPYAHLSEDQRNAMNAELHEAELKYGPRFAEAELIANENERRTKIDGLRNSFGTKQSMIRKKYGVRLRERRTKAEIAAEKERLGIKRAEKELAARESLGTTPQQNVGQAAAVASDVHPRPAGSGWTAANTPKAPSSAAVDEHDAKRRRVADGGGYVTPYKSVADETPTRKVSSGQDVPAAALASISRPGVPSRPPSQPSNEPSSLDMSSRLAPLSTPTSGPLKPEQPEPIAIDDDSSSSGDDEDIPPTLPAHVRKSLLNSPLRKASTGSGGMLGSPHSSVTPP
ncbi:hypothetical protein QBC43DRAFT_222546 [Cladorrhinum sp. PSN259]|nr:hypothetical protein QBC43DRAFT_222546 [Cladorrhinum sp. PSN259]